MNKILIKRALKSLFKNKLFMSLMFLLLLASSATYTLFQSISSSFHSSYNNLVQNGKLHDIVVKENFKIPSNEQVEVQLWDGKNKLSIDENNLQKVATFVSGKYVIPFVINKDYSADYGLDPFLTKNIEIESVYNGTTLSWSQILNGYNGVKGVLELAKDFELEVTNKLNDNISKSFVNAINDIYSNELFANEMKSLTVSKNEKAYKVIQYNQNTEVNKLISYSGSNSFTSSRTVDDMINELKNNIDYQGNSSGYEIDSFKGYKVFLKSKIANNVVQTAHDISSYEAIVSPTFAQANGKEAMKLEDFEKLAKSKYFFQGDIHNSGILDNNARARELLMKNYGKNIIMVDETPYFIVGIGLTPDMSYPIIDQQHPTVNTNDQALVYVNNRGYERILDGFRTNPKENYVSGKFYSNITSDRRKEIIDELEHIVKDGNAYSISNPRAPSFQKFEQYKLSHKIPTGNLPGLKMVTTFDDNSDQYLLTASRVSFLNQLQNSISTISVITTSTLIVFVTSIVIMVFKVLITSQRKQLATLLALGYSRIRISLTNAFISFAIGTIPTIIGYLIGYFTQNAFIGNFTDFWTIPTQGSAFSWIALLITIGLPTLLLFVLIAVSTFINIRFSIHDMLRDSIYDNSHLITKMLIPFKFIGIKTKYSISLIFRNVGKLALATIATTISSLAIMVGVSTIGTGNQAYNNTVAATNYEYKVDLTTPTTEGGEYQYVRYSQLSTLSHTQTYDDSTGIKNVNPSDVSSWHIPGLIDSEYASPSEIKNHLSDDKKTELASHYLDKLIQTQLLLEEKPGVWSIAERLMPENQVNLSQKNYQDFLDLDKLSTSAWNKMLFGMSQGLKPYLISYRNPVIDDNDETYTYIDSVLNTKYGEKPYHITGVKPNTLMYNHNFESLVDQNNGDIPIVINHYMSEYYGWNKNDRINGIFKNSVNRNFKNYKDKNVTYRIVDIIDGYNDGQILTLQKYANDLIGLSSNGFNGVMSKNKNSILLSSLPLYSPSGFYFGTDTLKGGWDDVVDSVLANHNIWQYGSTITDSKEEFYNKYSRTPFVSSINTVNWKQTDKYTFESVSKLSSSLINTIESVSIGLSIIFTIIVTSLMIRTNRKRISTLWTIGYRKREISRIFLSTFILPLGIAAAISIPISFGVLEMLRIFIMNFGHILIPISLTVWAPIFAIGILAMIFFASTIFSIASLSSNKALHAFKEN